MMRQYCSCEWNDKGSVLSLCAAHQAFEAKRCAGFIRDHDQQELMRQAVLELMNRHGWNERTAASVMLSVTSAVGLAPRRYVSAIDD